ncbi:MAG: glycoside hydrolase family 5 protein [Colwellia sp.]
MIDFIFQKIKFSRHCILMSLLITFATYTHGTDLSVSVQGHLSVLNGKIVNQYSKPVSLAGPSLFWSNDGWQGEMFYNAQTVKAFKDDWHASVIRAAMAAQGKGSYLTHPESNKNKVERVVEAAIDNDIYVIIDWHSHHAEENVAQAIKFFTEMATKYGNHANVIYEIYNEPLKDTDWQTIIKPYSEQVIAAIRKVDPDNLIIVGTQTWSQDVDKVLDSPVLAHKNLVYALHFYAGTHKADLRKRAQTAIDDGLALFVSEWGTVNADGDGAIDRQSTEAWLDFIRKNKLSHCSWSVTNKKENSAMLKPNVSSLGPWSNDQLTDNGKYLKSIISQWSAQ